MTPELDELVRAAQEARSFITHRKEQGGFGFNTILDALDKALAPYTEPKLVYVLPEWEEFVKGHPHESNSFKLARIGRFSFRDDFYNALREATRVEEK